jgi:hypothetical protein
MLRKIALLTTVLSLVATAVDAATPLPIEPRSVSWNIVSDAEMSRLCRQHGLRPNCEGMAAWDKEFRMCVIWTRSPRGPNDVARWQVVHHELQHCQEGHFHK